MFFRGGEGGGGGGGEWGVGHVRSRRSLEHEFKRLVMLPTSSKNI